MQGPGQEEIQVSLSRLLEDLEAFSVGLPEKVTALQRLRDHLKKAMASLGGTQKFRFKGLSVSRQQPESPPHPESVVDVLEAEMTFIQKAKTRLCEEIRNKIMPDIESLSLSFQGDGNELVKEYQKLVREFLSETSSRAVNKAHAELLQQYKKGRVAASGGRKAKMTEEKRSEEEQKHKAQYDLTRKAFLEAYQKSDGPRVCLATKLIPLARAADTLTTKCYTTIQTAVEKYAAGVRQYGLGVLDCSQAVTLGLGKMRVGEYSVLEHPKTEREMAEDRAAASAVSQEARRIGAVELVPSGGLEASPVQLPKDALWEAYGGRPEFSGDVKELLVVMRNFEQLSAA